LIAASFISDAGTEAVVAEVVPDSDALAPVFAAAALEVAVAEFAGAGLDSFAGFVAPASGPSIAGYSTRAD
jgi:hypothetical protein